MSVLYSIILAGGSGSRLWPLSREMFPKQIFKLEDEESSLFEKTFLRLASLTDDKNIITTTNVKHVSSVKEQLKKLQEKFCRKIDYKMITEPISKNTAPAITLAVKYISDIKTFAKESPIILVVPSDHIIPDREAFSSFIEKGIKLAQAGYIVSYGTQSEEVDEHFGYIKAKKYAKVSDIESTALKVSTFVEKATTKEKKELLNGKIYKNAGIYMFSIKTYISELKKHAKNIHDVIFSSEVSSSIPSIPLKNYEKLKDISIDYALMEKTKKLVVVPFDINWKDIGSWDAVYDVSSKDKNDNYFTGNVLDVGSSNSMVYSTSKLVATIGLEEKVVIETEDAILVCDKNNISNNIKNVYKKLNGKNQTAKEIHKTVHRPWGYYTVLEEGNGFLTKCITVNPDAKLSLQKHFHRSEHWIVLEGVATVVKGEKVLTLNSGQSVDIDIEEVHSLQNFGTEQLKILEVQQGDILDENDIVRIEDIYGRV